MIDIAITRRTLEEFSLSKDEIQEFKDIMASVSAGLCSPNYKQVNCNECRHRRLCDLICSYKISACMLADNMEE